MGTENVELMKMAKASLKGNWGLAIGTFLLYMFIMGFLQGMADYYPMIALGTLLITGPMTLGLAYFSLSIARDQNAQLQQIFDDKNKQMMNGYKMNLFLMFLMFLGMALLCILTLGIGFLWFIPFANVTLAKFYMDIKNRNVIPEVI